ncbi:MAG: HAMP domain-containing sensor histidine kinase [Pseudomonadota bacterium]
MRPPSSLFLKILSWFFLNIVIVSAALALFFSFQPQVNLRAVFGHKGIDRLRIAGMLIGHDLGQEPRETWPEILKRHAGIQNIDFALILDDGTIVSSTNETALPEAVMELAWKFIKAPPQEPGPRPLGRPKQLSDFDPPPNQGRESMSPKRMPPPPGDPGKDHGPPPGQMGSDEMHTMVRTKDPVRYWSGIRLPMPFGPGRFPMRAFLLAVSDSPTGNGFFFDPLPWMIAAVTIIVISLIFWTPMVRHITRPLTRITLATEAIARGRFDVAIHESRTDEIGRLARAVNHMTSRLSAFVTGQKRFLGDVAHELGSPIARIRFGLAALENRMPEKDRALVTDVMEDVAHMSNLVNELLAFTRASINAQSINLEQVNLLGVAKEAVRRESLPADCMIDIHIQPEIMVMASPESLTRALANLVRNAAKYAVSSEAIRISADLHSTDVLIHVADSGPGVPEHLLDQLFEPFFRPEPSRSRDLGGVGLGLAIVKTCVETCNGTVSARNLTPRGFAVTIRLKGSKAH